MYGHQYEHGQLYWQKPDHPPPSGEHEFSIPYLSPFVFVVNFYSPPERACPPPFHFLTISGKASSAFSAFFPASTKKGACGAVVLHNIMTKHEERRTGPLKPAKLTYYEARNFIETHPVCTNISHHDIRIMPYDEVQNIMQGKPAASTLKSLILSNEEVEPLH
jgi:hypothetical protein